jgi:hypothetical protein
MSNDFYIGTAPFCDPRGVLCDVTPGYEDGGKSKCGDGSCCWTGNKRRCTFNQNKWEKSDLYRELITEDPKVQGLTPKFNWFGKAPLCSATPCDVYEAGMVPIKSHTCGDGSCCVSGEKWLGIKPLSTYQKDLVKTGQKECMQLDQLKEQTIQEGLKFGAKVAESIAKAAI